jgi:ABC-type Zn2+ transport system substrate-binding protein/surface adhesin
MKCDSSKICGWITALSQLVVAAVILWVGYNVQVHMERMVTSWEKTSLAVQQMQVDVHNMETTMRSMDKRVWELNNRMGGVQRRMSPMGFMMP